MAQTKVTKPGIADDAVTTAKILDDAVTTAKILDDNVTTAKILDDNITTAKILDDNITTDKILNLNVTNAKIAAGTIDVTSKITGKVPVANLGTGTASATTYLAGDQTYKALSQYNDDALQNDIATLALHQATNANASKYNLANTNVDIYQDSTGVATFTDCARDSSGEYISSVQSADVNYSYTKLLLKSDGTAEDISAVNNTITGASVTWADTTITGKFGGNTIKFGQYYSLIDVMPSDSEWSRLGGTATGGRPHTLEVWVNRNSMTPTADERLWTKVAGSNYQMYSRPTGEWYCPAANTAGTASDTYENPSPTDGWHHFCFDYNTTDYKYAFYVDGVKKIEGAENSSKVWAANNSQAFSFGNAEGGSQQLNAYIDTMRISVGVSRYCTGGVVSSFTLPTTDTYDSTVVNATGNYVSTATTANASVSSVGIVMTYKNNEGTNALNTDIVAQVSADGGSNFTTCVLAAAGPFSTGVLQAVANDVSVTAGTSIQYKISFANQALGSKEARITGVSLIY